MSNIDDKLSTYLIFCTYKYKVQSVNIFNHKLLKKVTGQFKSTFFTKVEKFKKIIFLFIHF